MLRQSAITAALANQPKYYRPFSLKALFGASLPVNAIL
jgi:hypothetical protein